MLLQKKFSKALEIKDVPYREVVSPDETQSLCHSFTKTVYVFQTALIKNFQFFKQIL